MPVAFLIARRLSNQKSLQRVNRCWLLAETPKALALTHKRTNHDSHGWWPNKYFGSQADESKTATGKHTPVAASCFKRDIH